MVFTSPLHTTNVSIFLTFIYIWMVQEEVEVVGGGGCRQRTLLDIKCHIQQQRSYVLSWQSTLRSFEVFPAFMWDYIYVR